MRVSAGRGLCFRVVGARCYDASMSEISILVRVRDQVADVFRENELLRTFPVSTGKNGLGSERGSRKTPPGKLRVAKKVGDGHPLGTVFVEREPTGEVWDPAQPPIERDLITTRILWLEGLEPGRNAGQDAEGRVVDTKARFVYIHGTNQSARLGTPNSHGCILLSDDDVLDLFDRVAAGTPVYLR